jgi:hypothetical protein
VPLASDAPMPLEPRGMNVNPHFSEEFKEALLRAKGEGRAVLMVIKNGNWEVDGHVYNIEAVNPEQDTLTLKIIRPVEPTEQKKTLVKSIVAKLSKNLHGSIDSAIERALLEKTDGDLELISRTATRPTTKVERRRGCFFLVSDEVELLL